MMVRSILLPSLGLLLSLVGEARAAGGTPDRSGGNANGPEHSPGRRGGKTDNPPLYSTARPSFLFLLADDIGWADFGYNNGTARTPNIDAWARRDGSTLLQDFHSGGTVCSPTRATVLTGRNHFRDCVDFVYGCSDMSTCLPDFEFAPSRTFTVGDAVRSVPGDDYSDGAFFAGKWHLGSFYNDSEAYGGRTSSPKTHGFHHMNATIGVAPTAGTPNCMCKSEWHHLCEFGHNEEATHCFPDPKNGGTCCFNYWWDDPMSPHGVTNLTWPATDDDAVYLADAFSRFLASRRRETAPTRKKLRGGSAGAGAGDDGGVGGGGEEEAVGGPPAPFFAQISFHNCHIPFVGTKHARESCASNRTCRPPDDGSPPYTSEELDYYACVTQLDDAVGTVLAALEREGYYDNTMIWLGSDNGPEGKCHPEAICKRAEEAPQRPAEGPGSAGPLRGRKRDIYEGGHRVPGVISWPAVIPKGAPKVSWETVVTTDFLPTVMDVLGVDRPEGQKSWAMDGRSVLPILRGGRWEDTDGGPRGFGIGFFDANVSVVNGWGYRLGRWKYVEGSKSCLVDECRRAQLFDLETDLGERHDLSKERPEVLEMLQRRFQEWHESVMRSRVDESRCTKPSELLLPESIQTLTRMEGGDDDGILTENTGGQSFATE